MRVRAKLCVCTTECEDSANKATTRRWDMAYLPLNFGAVLCSEKDCNTRCAARTRSLQHLSVARQCGSTMVGSLMSHSWDICSTVEAVVMTLTAISLKNERERVCSV